MQIPSLITIQGAYDYFLALLLLIAFALALYIAGSYFGILPSPSELVPHLVAPPSAVAPYAVLP